MGDLDEAREGQLIVVIELGSNPQVKHGHALGCFIVKRATFADEERNGFGHCACVIGVVENESHAEPRSVDMNDEVTLISLRGNQLLVLG